jgi:hypothetical protein
MRKALAAVALARAWHSRTPTPGRDGRDMGADGRQLDPASSEVLVADERAGSGFAVVAFIFSRAGLRRSRR